jgi:hypothetical protein
MIRSQAFAMARRVKRTLFALQDQPRVQAGVVLSALVLAEEVAADGKIEERVWLRACGIAPGSFRQGKGKLMLDLEEGEEGGEEHVSS